MNTYWTSCTTYASLMASETFLCPKMWSDSHDMNMIVDISSALELLMFFGRRFEYSENFPLGRPSSSSSWETKVLVNLCGYVCILIGLFPLPGMTVIAVIANFTFTLIQIKDASIFNDSGDDDTKRGLL